MAIDIGMQELQSEWRVTDVKGNVTKMRQERGGSVQTAVQYKFIHQALEEYVAVVLSVDFGLPRGVMEHLSRCYLLLLVPDF
jgi:hypothetical protein